MKLKKLISVNALLFITLLSCYQNSNAQLTKGNWLFEGNLGNISFNNGNSKNTGTGFKSESVSKNFNIDFYTRAGYFLTNDFALGADLGLGFNNGTYESTNTNGIKTSESKSSSTYMNVGPFVRYYLPSTKQTFRFYGQVGAGINMTLSIKNEGKSFNGTTGVLSNDYFYNYPKKYNTFSANGAIGMNYFLSGTTALNSSIGYYYSKAKQTTNFTSTSGGVTTTSDNTHYEYDNSRISWSLGFTIFIDKNKNTTSN